MNRPWFQSTFQSKFQSTAVLAVPIFILIFGGCNALSVAQTSERKASNGSLQAMLHIPMKHAKGAKSDKPSAAVVEGLAKQKVYAFRTVDYPAATINTVNQYNDTTAVGYFAYPSSDATAFYFK